MPSISSLRPRRPPLFNSLGVGLFVWLFLLVIAAFAAYVFLSVRATERQWRKAVQSGALAWSELIQQATHDAMLLNRKKDVHRIIQTVAATPGVVGVRIYDPQGKIVYSADEREVGRRVNQTAEACVTCHGEGRDRLSAISAGERVRVLHGADGHRVLGLINPIENSAACSSADCHAHSKGQSVLGVLDVKVSMENADNLLADARRLSLTAATLMALVVGASSALFIQRFVRRPVLALIEGTERIARGDLDTTLDVDSQSEMGHLASAFNRMTRDLAQARRENEEWSQNLERKVIEETEKLSRTQREVVHMEKMASLGTLAATVAHELNNPLAGILNYAKLVERSLQEGTVKSEEQEVRRFLHVIQQEAGRCGKIVRNFLLFTRRSGGELALHPLNPIVEQSLAIIRHHLEMSRVEVSWLPETGEAGGGDQVICDAGQIQQALMDLFVNAVEAMPEGGTLTVALRAMNGQVEISVADTGVGIPREAMPRIFEPFFTTKEGKVGAGLGLSVVYGIVERHGGRIEVESEVGHGTTFRLTLPREAKQPPNKEEPS